MKRIHRLVWLEQDRGAGWVFFLGRYGLALLLTLGMWLLLHGLSPALQQSISFAFFSIVIALSAGLGGLGPGLFVTVCGAILTHIWFMDPRGSLAIRNLTELGVIISFLIVGGLLSLIIEALRRALQRARAHADRFRALFERAPLGKALIDPDTGRFILVNTKLCEITGYSERELLSMTFQNITYPEDRAPGQEIFERLVRGEINQFSMEKRYVRGGDGRLIWGEVMVNLLRAKSGRPLYAIGSIVDITRRKQAEDALRESEARYRQVMRSTGSVIVGLDTAGRITMYSGYAQQLFGYTENEVLGRHVVGTIVPPQDSHGRDMYALIADMINNLDQHLYQENENQTKDGRRLWMAWSNRPILEADGFLREVISVGLDLTERKRIEEALRLNEERLRAIYERAPLGIAQVGMDGHLEDVNDALCRMLGYTREELLDKTSVELTHPEDRESDERMLVQLIAGEAPISQMEKRYLRKSGEPIWVRVTSSVTSHPHAYRIAIVEDISMRMKAESLQSERTFLREVIDATPSMIFVKDVEGRFILANEALATTYGTSVQGLIGKTDADFHPHVDELELFRRDDLQVMNTRQEKLIPEERLTTASGEVLWFSTFKVPLINEDGTCDKVLCVATDITQRKRAEEALRRSEAQYRTLLETIPQMVWTILPNGLHDFCNHYWYDYTGLDLEQTINSGWAAVLHPDESSGALTAWLRAFEAGQSLETENRLRRAADGVYRWHYTRIVPIRDDAQRIVKWIGTAVDIHERHVAEEALYEANDRLAAADRQKDEFLAMLAHELRNPLAPIRNAVQILTTVAGESDIIDTRLMRQHGIIERQVSHMARLLDDLLDVSRVTRGKIDLRKQSLPLTDVLAHAIEMNASLIESRRQTLHVTMPPEDLYVEGDIDRLAQVLGNLLSNAAKYTDEGGQIWLESWRETERAMIRVRDNGIGITPEMLPHVFELFTQADQSLGRSSGGLGIGLTMVHKLVQLHGGTVEAHSPGLGQGSEFLVHLPALPTPPKANAMPASSTPSVPLPAAAVRVHRILIVDDVVDTAESLAELLRTWGHDVQTAYSGPAALEAAPGFRPDVVFLDIGMPGMDGNAVARRLRQMPEMAGAQLVALTGYGQDQDREAALAAGFDTLFVKPIDLNALRENVVGAIK